MGETSARRAETLHVIWPKKCKFLARLTNFCDFYDFRKAIATAFLQVSIIPMVKVEIYSFYFYLFKNLSPSVKSVPRKVEFRVQTERFFGNARRKKTKFLRDSCLVWQDSLGNAFCGKHFVDTANLHGTPVESFNWIAEKYLMTSKMYTIIQLIVVSFPQHISAANLLYSHSSDVYK